MKKLLTASLVLAASMGVAQAADRTLKMATIAPSLGQAITMATFANVVSDKLDGVSIEVSGGGAATLHQLEVGRGNLDFAMTSPVIYHFLKNGIAMYKNEPEAPQVAENVSLLMLYPYGAYHFAVRADSDIQTLDDMEGASVFLGPQGGGAYSGARDWVTATTGLVANEDYDAIKANWQTGFQAFLDGKIDVYVNGCLDPCGQFLQFTETEELRFIGPENAEGEEVEKYFGDWRFPGVVEAGLYKGQMNEGPVNSTTVDVGIAVRTDLDEELVYQITKAFWDNIEQVTSDAPWAAALNLEHAVQEKGGIKLHPGAARYYREVGAIN